MRVGDLCYAASGNSHNAASAMSRSRRKTPITGMTNSASEKYDKQAAVRRGRKWVHDHLAAEVAAGADFDLPGYEHPKSGGFIFAKDGKIWLGHSRRHDVVRLMRKQSLIQHFAPPSPASGRR